MILPLAFFVWLAAIALFHVWKYVEHRNFETDQDEPLLLFASVHDDGNAKPSALETLAEGDESMEEALVEPLLDAPTSRRGFMTKESLDASGQAYFFQTFDRIKVKQPNMSSLSSGSDDEKNEKVTPQQVYKIVAGLERNLKLR